MKNIDGGHWLDVTLKNGDRVVVRAGVPLERRRKSLDPQVVWWEGRAYVFDEVDYSVGSAVYQLARQANIDPGDVIHARD
jgi:hypothetical protein